MSVCSELQYVLEDAQAKFLLTSPGLAEQMQPLAEAANVHLHTVGQAFIDESCPQVRVAGFLALSRQRFCASAFLKLISNMAAQHGSTNQLSGSTPPFP